MEPLPGIDIQAIENYQAVLQRFGAWPSFHDAEIHSVLMDRTRPDGPYLEMRIHVHTVKAEPDREGRYIDKQAMVTMRFSRMESEEIVGFNEQNSIFDMDMQCDQDHIKVEISSSYGCAGSFTCKHVAIRSVEDFDR
jgi:hypothetical protein